MKLVMSAVMISLSTMGVCQSSKLFGKLISMDTARFDVQYFTVELCTGKNVLLTTVTDYSGSFKFNNIPNGQYRLVITKIGYRDIIKDSLNFERDTVLYLTVQNPPPCLYHYAANTRPHCKMGHDDHIIPIKYGLPGKKMMRLAKKGKIWLGGCVMTDCNPEYYCTIHKMPV